LFKRAREGHNEESARKMVSLLEYFINEVCEKAWGISDPWSDVSSASADPCNSVLARAAQTGCASFVSTVLEKSGTANVPSAAAQAYKAGFREAFEVLIDDERCTELVGSERPLVVCIFWSLSWPRIDEPRQEQSLIYQQQRTMMEMFLRRWPECATSSKVHGKRRLNLLHMAVGNRDPDLTRIILELTGGSLNYDEKKETIRGEEVLTVSTLSVASRFPCAEVLQLLHDAGAFKAERYDAPNRRTLADILATLVCCSFPLKPKYEERYRGFCKYRKDIEKVLSLLVLDGARFTSSNGVNEVMLSHLFETDGCIMEEEHAIALLRKCKEAGWDIIHKRQPAVDLPDVQQLVHLASIHGCNKLVDLAIEFQGRSCLTASYWHSANAAHTDGSAVLLVTPLTVAILNKQFGTALFLLREHRVLAAYKDALFDPLEQPLIVALETAEDELVVPTVEALIKRDPSLCDLDCYREEEVDNPIMSACKNNMFRCLEVLLRAKLPGVEEQCRKECVTAVVGSRIFKLTPAAAFACNRNWGMVTLMLSCYPSIPVTAKRGTVGSDGAGGSGGPDVHPRFPSILAEVRRGDSKAPRSLIVMVEAIARKQIQEAVAKATATSSGAVVSSNAFEDPSVKMLTVAQEKKKAKKRAAKKRAKERKRAAAAEEAAVAGVGANAGAGKANGDTDSDSSGTDDEEKGMDEEEKTMHRAPTFDLEKERAARKAERDAEAKAEARKDGGTE
jgi:hypothetical protein